MLQNLAGKNARKALNADTIGPRQRRCTSVPDAKGVVQKAAKTSGFKRIVIKNSSIKIFTRLTASIVVPAAVVLLVDSYPLFCG